MNTTIDSFIKNLFTDPKMLGMGHGQSEEDLNLGLGWLYYGFARMLRAKTAVVIGSYRGFTPAVIANGLLSNEQPGKVIFIDPSYVDVFWQDPQQVKAHFAKLGTPNVEHHQMTTQEFVLSPTYEKLDEVGLLMIDGLHTADQAQFDYLGFLPKLTDNSIVLFHDSMTRKVSKIYGEENSYPYSVVDFIERLMQTPGVDCLNLPMIGDGLSIVRGIPDDITQLEKPFS